MLERLTRPLLEDERGALEQMAERPRRLLHRLRGVQLFFVIAPLLASAVGFALRGYLWWMPFLSVAGLVLAVSTYRDQAGLRGDADRIARTLERNEVEVLRFTATELVRLEDADGTSYALQVAPDQVVFLDSVEPSEPARCRLELCRARGPDGYYALFEPSWSGDTLEPTRTIQSASREPLWLGATPALLKGRLTELERMLDDQPLTAGSAWQTA